MIPENEGSNFELVRDCLSTPLIAKFSSTPPKPRRKRRGKDKHGKAAPVNTGEEGAGADVNDAEDLAEFVDYIATEIFTSLPADLRILTYEAWSKSPALQALYTPPLTPNDSERILLNLSPSTTDSLTTYGLLPSGLTPSTLLQPVLSSYLTTITTPPPPPSSTKSSVTGCELCLRDWVSLTYHHLIPKFVSRESVEAGLAT